MDYKVNFSEGIENIDCYLFDMDGTLYLGNELIDGADEFIEYLKNTGRKVFYISNNSSKTAEEYIKKLDSLGIKSKTEDFFISADACAKMINDEKPHARLFVLGTKALCGFFERKGFDVIYDYRTEPSERPDYAVLGFDTTMTYEKLRIFCDYIMDGVKYISTHPDMVCPAENHRVIPDAGSFILLIEGVTGKRPEFIAGKPQPCMINMIAEMTGIPKDKIAVVGDRLHTDIMSGINAGVKTVCVLSGETDEALLKSSPTHPDYVFGSVKDILEALKCSK